VVRHREPSNHGNRNLIEDPGHPSPAHLVNHWSQPTRKNTITYRDAAGEFHE
jgi:hypothetical protein